MEFECAKVAKRAVSAKQIGNVNTRRGNSLQELMQLSHHY